MIYKKLNFGEEYTPLVRMLLNVVFQLHHRKITDPWMLDRVNDWNRELAFLMVISASSKVPEGCNTILFVDTIVKK